MGQPGDCPTSTACVYQVTDRFLWPHSSCSPFLRDWPGSLAGESETCRFLFMVPRASFIPLFACLIPVVSCFVVLFCFVLSYPVLSCLILSCVVLSCLIVSSLVLCCLLLSCIVLCCLMLSGGDPLRGSAIVPRRPPAKNGLAAIFALLGDRGGQRGFLPGQGEGPHLAYLR